MPDPALLKLFASFFLGGFVSLVTIINPLATIPFFTGLSGHLSDREARAMARRASIYCLAILLVSLFAGTLVLTLFGISTEIRELNLVSAEVTAYCATALAMVSVCVLELIVLRSARLIASRMGESAIEVMSRLMGFLLFCVGVQFIASGIRTFMTSG